VRGRLANRRGRRGELAGTARRAELRIEPRLLLDSPERIPRLPGKLGWLPQEATRPIRRLLQRSRPLEQPCPLELTRPLILADAGELCRPLVLIGPRELPRAGELP
jgi:hypothetical protein